MFTIKKQGLLIYQRNQIVIAKMIRKTKLQSSIIKIKLIRIIRIITILLKIQLKQLRKRHYFLNLTQALTLNYQVNNINKFND